jgi:hypothetical protein
MKNRTPKCGISFPATSVALVSLLVFVIAFGGTAWSQTARAKEDQLKDKQLIQTTKTAAPVEGQKAAIDPATKQLRQLTSEEAKALSEELKKFVSDKAGEVKIFKFANGTIAAELPEEFMDSIVVTRNPDGSLSTECVSGLKKDKTPLRQPAKDASKPKLEEE